jgi:2-succinyl-6-hydroxy-2,4-cyclohexadiene-1-carboxylate synthase
MTHSAARELIAEGAEKQVGVDGGHDPGMAAEIVLLHGFTHTGASWQPVIRHLGERYKALAPDIRGHGAATAAEPVTLEAVIGDVRAIMLDRCALAGYSMGGRLALHVALSAPERVDRLILVGASPGLADPRERQARRHADEALADEIETMTMAEFARRWANGTTVLAGQPARVREAAHADRLRNSPPALARALRGLGTGALPSLWDRLSGLTVPTVLVVGERDRKFRVVAEQMAARLPRAETVVVPGAGHAVHLEAPAAVAEIIAPG